MAIRAVLPLLVVGWLTGVTGCRRPPVPHSSVDAALGPALVTKFLETRLLEDAPPPPAELKTSSMTSEAAGRREGGVPEVVNVADDCTVHAVWWAAHLCGMAAKGDAQVNLETGWMRTAVTLSGTPRTDCPAQLTRWETVASGLPAGTYRFGTERKFVELTVRCTRPR